jgi:hypothetical protein
VVSEALGDVNDDFSQTPSRLQPKSDRTKSTKPMEHTNAIYFFSVRIITPYDANQAVNGVIQLAKRTIRGFKNFGYFRTAAYQRGW